MPPMRTLGNGFRISTIFWLRLAGIYTDARKLPVGTLRGSMKARGAFRRLLSGRQGKSGEPLTIM
jgi:hypothetical protein